MRRVAAVLLIAGVLTGCASHPSESPWLVQRELNPPKSCDPLTADQELVLGLSQEMVSAGRRHAALANLERLPNSLPAVRLSKARLLRLLGHGGDADRLYASLLGTCLVADGQHGLGQIEAGRGHYPEAQNHLRAAASLSPANEAIRNDLGVVYMNQRRLSEARFELLTAMELNENARRAPQNLLVLLIYQGNWQGARELVSAKGLTSDDFARAERRAKTMRSEDLARQAPTVAQQQIPATVGAPTPVPAPGQPVTSTAAPALSRAPIVTPIQKPAQTPAKAAASTQAATPMRLSVAARAWALEKVAADAGTRNRASEVQRKPVNGARPLVCRSTAASGSRSAVLKCEPE